MQEFKNLYPPASEASTQGAKLHMNKPKSSSKCGLGEFKELQLKEVTSNFKTYVIQPPVSREVANLTERKNPHTPVRLIDLSSYQNHKPFEKVCTFGC